MTNSTNFVTGTQVTKEWLNDVDALRFDPDGASLLSYIPAGVGAVATTVQDKLRESVSVKDFGAVGDGVTDDTVAIQAALDSGSYDIYVPAGSYKTTAEIVINTNGIWLHGAGAERTKIIQNTAGANGITSNTAIDRLLWCEISDLRVEMPGGTTGNGIWIRNPEVFTGRHLRVTTLSGTKTLGYGIIVEKESVTDYGYYVLLEHSHVDKCSTGVYITGQSPGGANGNWCEKVISNNNTNYGFHIRNNAGSFLNNCAAEQNEHNVYLEGGGYVWVTNGRYERPNTHNVYVGNGAAFKIQNCLLASAGNVNTATGRGVYVASGQFVEITGNTFQDGFSSYDIEVVAGSLETVILDNKARNAASGWDVGGPRVLDDGTRTFKRHLVNTAAGASVRHQSTERFDSGSVLIGNAGTGIYSGSGSPETIVAADSGSIYFRDNGGNSNSVYVKENGDGTNTGWYQVYTFLIGSATYDPPSIAAASSATTTVTVTGAALGDFALASFSVDTAFVILSAVVSSSNTVRVSFFNPTAGPIDLGSGTLRVRVSKG